MAASDFIAKYGDTADKIAAESGIPAERILGQAGLETGWNSAPAGNNFFGIKGPGQNLATHEADASGALVPTTQSFRAYANPEDSFRDYAKLIQTGYKGALSPSLDDAGFASAVKAGGYATDPNYAVKLHGSIQTARQHHSGWQPVPASDLVGGTPIGAGAGFLDSGKKDDGWEPVPSSDLATDTPAPPQANAAPGEYSLGGLAQNAGTDLGNIWEGVKATGKRAVGDVTSAVQGNFAPAAGDMVSAMKALNPFVAAAKNVQQGIPMVKEAITDPAQAAKDTADYVYQKPVTSAMNAAAVAFPGAAPGAVMRGATSAVRGADAVLAPTLGRVLTGLPGSLQREASRAGEAGGAQGAAFRGQFKGTAPGDVTVDLAKGAAKEIQDASYAEKKAGESQWAGKMVSPDAMDDVQTALDSARKSNRDVAGIVQSPETEATLDALQKHIDTAAPGGTMLPGVRDVEGFDALKRRMGDTLSADGGSFDTGPGSRVYHATRQALIDAHPEYAAHMEKSQNAIESAKQMRKQLSLGSTNDATVAGALQRAARNDASGAYGMRKDQLMKLVQQKPELLSAIAGQALNAAHPRGITPMLALSVPGHVALGPAGVLTGLLQYALGIPKLHGTARYALGALTRRTGQVGLSQANIGRILDIARIVGTQSKPNQDIP